MFEKKMVTITIQPTDQGPDILISSQNRGLSTSPLIIALAHDLLQEQSIKDRYSKLKRDEALEIKFRLTRIWFLINPRVRIVKYQNWYFNLCINPVNGFMFFTRSIMRNNPLTKENKMETEDRFGWYTITIIAGAIVTWLITWPIDKMIDKYATKVFLPSFNK